MGYLHIENAYKADWFFAAYAGQEVWALEKIHGTSAHVRFDGERLHFFSGGCKQDPFEALFDKDALASKMGNLKLTHPIVVYGEAYGGKLQGMAKVYGDQLRFVAFDVKCGDVWLDVPTAHHVCSLLGIEFVSYTKVICNAECLDAERDRFSAQAIRNGVTSIGIGEGIVVRPLVEAVRGNGQRMIMKHKRPEFRETLKDHKIGRQIDQAKLDAMTESSAFAEEWVTEERLNHVLDHLLALRTDAEKDRAWEMKDTPVVVRAMLEDVKRESATDAEFSGDAKRNIGQRTAKLFKARVAKLPVSP